tara:strand:- start:41 stop:487 length:447 start_codon:yes stop_codon:yes gene_type:complete
MKTILKFTEFVNENLNEANLPSWVESGPYDNLKGMFAEDFEGDDYDNMTIADVDKNYKPALKYLGVKSIADMGYLSSTANDDDLYDIVDSQMKSSNFLGNDRGKGMNPTPYTGAYKGMLGDVKIIILQDINQENMYAYAAGDSRGNLK